MTDTIKKLAAKIEELICSSRNQRIIKVWKTQNYTAKDHWRGIPLPSTTLETIPFTVEPELPMWAEILEFDVENFYTDPNSYLENTLRMMIYRFEHFEDFTCIEKTIPVWLGTTLESSLLGSRTIFVKGESPWIDREPLIKDYEDLDRLDYPDFHKSGLMPLVHRMYSEISELVEGNYTVVFPEWARGPFGVAMHIRGLENLLSDMLLKPDFVHRLMRFVTNARKEWIKERAAFLERKVDKGNLYNDEVNCPTISPQQYEEFVLPYEVELSEFHGGITYWHSCGDTTKLLDSIRKISSIEMFHIGPWTDIRQAKRVFGKDTALEKCLMPTEDIQRASEKEMEEKLDNIRAVLDGTSYTVRADGLQVINSLDTDVTRLKRWIEVAKKKLLVKSMV